MKKKILLILALGMLISGCSDNKPDENDVVDNNANLSNNEVILGEVTGVEMSSIIEANNIETILDTYTSVKITTNYYNKNDVEKSKRNIYISKNPDGLYTYCWYDDKGNSEVIYPDGHYAITSQGETSSENYDLDTYNEVWLPMIQDIIQDFSLKQYENEQLDNMQSGGGDIIVNSNVSLQKGSNDYNTISQGWGYTDDTVNLKIQTVVVEDRLQCGSTKCYDADDESKILWEESRTYGDDLTLPESLEELVNQNIE